jgi:glycosyltransferase involved in cell wall biosynthesis
VKIAGEGGLREELERMCAELHLSESVEFLGFVDDTESLLKGAGVFVMSSRWEGLPISLLQAVALGVPVVATSVGANRELLRSGETGRLVPPEDPAALADAIAAAVQRPEEAERMAVRAFLVLKDRYSVHAMVGSVRDVYEDLLAASGRRRVRGARR